MWCPHLTICFLVLGFVNHLIPISNCFPLSELGSPDNVPLANGSTEASVVSYAGTTRSVSKRDVRFRCNDAYFRGLLSVAFKDAVSILDNMVQHLDLAINLYKDDDSGELKDEKRTKSLRNFDEHNAFASYNQMISKIYWSPGHEENKAGLARLKYTRAVSSYLLDSFRMYDSGTPRASPNINVFCREEGLFSEFDLEGRSWDEAKRGPRQNGRKWWLVQLEGGPSGGPTWIERTGVCGDTSNADTIYGGVPIVPGINAYVLKAITSYGLEAETMLFCPRFFERWRTFETSVVADGVHYDELHVPIGSEPSPEQREAVANLQGNQETTRWLGGYLVHTLIHESTHSAAFSGDKGLLVDLDCYTPDDELRTTATDPGCMYAISQGKDNDKKHESIKGKYRGHKCAECFAVYAMAVYTNSVSWFKTFQAKGREG